MRKTQPAAHTVRVLVADSSPIHTQLLAEAIGRDRRLTVVGSTANSGGVIKRFPECRPDVLLISASLDEQPERGLEVLQELRAIEPGLKAVTLLDSSKPETVVQAFRSGAKGVFCRNAPVKTLCRCIAVVYGGQIWASSEELGFVLAALASPHSFHSLRPVDANGMALLSPREQDVVGCLAEGLSNREIAQQLGISQHTVKNYLFRIFDKLGVSSRMELLFYVLHQEYAISNSRHADIRSREAKKWSRSEQRRVVQAQATEQNGPASLKQAREAGAAAGST